jgi:imidazolonepropionase-like amidohydrolase/predicted enzyme related to lactoylglutathione lyase
MKRCASSPMIDKNNPWVAFLWMMVFLLFSTRALGSEPTLEISNARVIVGNGDVIEGATVLVAGDRIQRVSREGGSAGAARMIDAEGLTLMPGLMDTHVHFFGVTARGEASFRQQIETLAPGYLKVFLEHGVTTVKSAADPLALVLDLRARVAEGRLPGPRILVAGPCFTAPGGHPAVTLGREDPWMRSQIAIEVEDAETARREVRRLADSGVDAIKAALETGQGPGMPEKLPRLSVDVLRAIVAEAHAHNLRVTVHTHREQDVLDALAAGVDGVEHGVWDLPLGGADVAELLRARTINYTPTLWIFGLDRKTPAFEIAKKNLKTLADRGVNISLGSDTLCSMPWPGRNTIQEMEYMAEAGLPPELILRAATRQAAEHLGLIEDLGTIEPGKLADVILVDGNPLEDIAALRNIRLVIKEGRIVHEASATLGSPKGIPPNSQPVSWFEIPVLDMDRAKTFYEDVLDVKLQRLSIGPNEMALFPTIRGAAGATGALMKGEPFQPSGQGVIIYFHTPDIDGVIARAQQRGVNILLPKTPIGPLGFIAAIEDSEGNRFGLRSWP